MSEPTGHERELRALLRSADPAASLSPADPAGLADLIHRIQEDDMPDATDQPARPASPRRTTAWVAAAAAAAVIGGGGYAVVSGITADKPADYERDVAALPEPLIEGEDVLTLEAGAVAGRCAVPTPEILAQFDVVFAGTVTAVDDEVATLTPTQVYAGQGIDLVERVAVRNYPDLGILGTPVDFSVGETYLVAAEDGIVSPCGFSGPATGDLQALYVAAFG